MTQCETMRRLLQAELDGEISPEDEAVVQQHVAECDACAADYAEQKGLATLFAEDRATIRAPANLTDRIMDSITDRADDEVPKETTTNSTMPSPTTTRVLSFAKYLRPVAAAAVLMLVVGVSFYTGRVSAQETPPSETETLQELLDRGYDAEVVRKAWKRYEMRRDGAEQQARREIEIAYEEFLTTLQSSRERVEGDEKR